jgi:hypothetical protein
MAKKYAKNEYYIDLYDIIFYYLVWCLIPEYIQFNFKRYV